MRRPLTIVVSQAALIACVALLGGCGPSVERAYSKCAEIAYKQAVSGSKGLLPKEMATMLEKSARAQAENRCSFIREECNRDPQSENCRRLIEQYGK